MGYSPCGCKRVECDLTTKQQQQSQFCCRLYDLGEDAGLFPLALPALCPGSWPKAALVGSLTLWLQLDERGECGLDALPAGLGLGSGRCLSQRLLWAAVSFITAHTDPRRLETAWPLLCRLWVPIGPWVPQLCSYFCTLSFHQALQPCSTCVFCL